MIRLHPFATEPRSPGNRHSSGDGSVSADLSRILRGRTDFSRSLMAADIVGG